MKLWVKILLIAIGIFLIIQIPIFNPDKNYTEADTEVDITDKYEVPMNVQMHLYKSCYDCHSNYTEDYPWYYNIQPVSWWMDHHIKTAKELMNFSEFADYSEDVARKKFEKIHKVSKYHTMPLNYYRWMHKDVIPTDEEYKTIAEWAQDMQDELDAEKDSVQSD